MKQFLLVAGLGLLAFTGYAADTLSHGNAHIHVIPSLSQPSVKNGGKITVSAVVKASASVASVTADMGGIETLTLYPSSPLGGANADSSLGVWSAEWTGQGLEERIYNVVLKVADRAGHTFEDNSLRFSDPAAGISTPGTTNYPNGNLARISGLALQINEDQCSTAVIDVAAGYAYFGTGSAVNPGAVVKVALGSGDTAPVEVGTATLNIGEQNLGAAVIDPGRGFALFGTNNGSNIQEDYIVKISLGAGNAPPARVGVLALPLGEYGLTCAVNDVNSGPNGTAYFGCNTLGSGVVVKIDPGAGNAAPTRVTSITFNGGEAQLTAACIDTTSNFAYFGTNTAPAKVVKVDLTTFTRVSALTLNIGNFEQFATCAVIDTAAGFAYFGMDVHPGRIVKVNLATFTAVGTLTLPGSAGNENYLKCAVIHPAQGYAYFGCQNGYVARINLNGAATPTEPNSTLFANSISQPFCAVLDPTTGHVLFGTQNRPSVIKKFNIVNTAVAPIENPSLTLQTGEASGTSCLLDVANKYAYMGTNTNPGHFIKIDVSTTPPTRIADLTLSLPFENAFNCGVIDAANGVALIAGTSSIVKINLGSGSNAPTRVGGINLTGGDANVQCGVIDAAGTYAYFGSFGGNVVKIALNAPASAPTKVGSLTLNAGESNLFSAAIDNTTQIAYYCTYTSPARLVKVALNGAGTPVRINAVTLAENLSTCLAVDTVNQFAYVGIQSQPAMVAKINLATLTEVTPPLTLNNGEDYASCITVDAPSSTLLLGFGGQQGQVARLAFNGADTPQRLGVASFLSNEIGLSGVALDGAGTAYFSTGSTPAYLLSMSYSQRGYLKGTKVTLSEDAVVNDVRFYSHNASGNASLAIYSSDDPKILLWSGSAANTKTNDFVTIPISAGTPKQLVLTANTYHLAWQVDSTASVPSFTAGNPGDGFFLQQDYGAFPAQLNAPTTSTSETWTEFLTYDKPFFKLSASPTQVAGASQMLTITIVNQDGVTLPNYAPQGAPLQLVFSGANSSLNPVTAPTVNGVAFGTPTDVTFTNGVATVPLVLYRAEAVKISATDTVAVTSVTADINVTPGPVASLKFNTQPGNGTAKAPLAQQPVVRAFDAYGNTLIGVPTPITMTIQINPGGGVLSGTTKLTTALLTGDAVFTDLSIDTAGVGYTLSAASGAVTTSSTPFNLATSPLVLTGPTAMPPSGAVGQNISFTSSCTGGSGPLTFSWNFGDTTNASGANVTHAYTTGGTFNVILTVTDTATGLASGNTSVTITVPPPLVLTSGPAATPNPANVGDTITFTADASGGAAPLTFKWDFGDTTTGTGATITHAYSTANAFNVGLTVTDSANVSVTGSVKVTVNPPGVAPLAFTTAAKAAPNPAAVGATVTLSCAATGGVAPLTFKWNFGDSTTGTGASVTHAYATAGSFNAVVTVTDSGVGSITSMVTVTVGGGPGGTGSSPLTVASGPTADPNPVTVGQPATFSCTCTGGTGTLLYTWDFGDGTTGTGSPLAHTFPLAAIYNVNLKVTDAAAGSATTSLSVTVNPANAVVGFGPDSDGDGFSDALELALSTNAASAADTPTGLPAGVPSALTLTKLSVKLNFAKPGNDNITVNGTLPIDATFHPADALVLMDVGGVAKKFKLTAKASVKTGNDSFKLTVKSKKGVIQATPAAKFTATFAKGKFADTLALSSKLDNADLSKQPRPIVVTLILNSTLLQKTADTHYTAKHNKTGNANSP